VSPTTRTARAVTALSTRLVRRGALLLSLSAAAYVAVEVASFGRTYPNGVSSDQFDLFADNPAARMLQGVPHAVDSAGGFTVWDAGWLLELVAGTWGVLAASRLLRADEDTERAELMLVGPLRASRVCLLQLLVLLSGGLLCGVSVALALAGTGSDVGGSVAFGLALAGFVATCVGVSSVTSQLVGVRRRAVGSASAVLGLTFLVRMVANSTDDRAWLGWCTPFGWMDKLQAFGDLEPGALVALWAAPAVLVTSAVILRGRRDTGGALLASSDSRGPRLRGLGGPAAFGWRSNRAVLVAWVLGLGAYAALVGSLIPTTIDFLEDDADYRRVLDDLGLDVALSAEGFLGVIGVTLGVGFALYVAWRLGAARDDEASGRADNLLVGPVTRSRWLAAHAGLTLVGAALLSTSTAVAIWIGARAAGSTQLSLGDVLRSVTLNTGSVVVLVTGLTVLAFGAVPRLTLAVPISVTVGGYVLTITGPAMSWPDWVVNVSPFSHLSYVPVEPFAATSATAMGLLGLAATVGGLAAFSRRDIVGA
jgi:ABC-2 type transport system permease protein